MWYSHRASDKSQKQVWLVSGVNIGILIPQAATVPKGYLNDPIRNLHQNVPGHMASSVREGLWNLTFAPFPVFESVTSVMQAVDILQVQSNEIDLVKNFTRTATF